MIRRVIQTIEVSVADEEKCSWTCPFFSSNKRRPICWLARAFMYIENGRRTPYCLSLKELLFENTNPGEGLTDGR